MRQTTGRLAAWGGLLGALALSLGVGGCASVSRSDAELRVAADDALRTQQYARVLALDSELLKRSPDDFDSSLQRAIAFDRLGRQGVAYADYSRAIELEPKAALPRLYRANLSLKMGQTEAALTDLGVLNGLTLKPNEQVAQHTLRGTALQLQKRYGAALASYRRAVQIGGRDPDIHSGKHYRDALHNQAACQYHLGDFRGALQSMQKKVKAMQLAGTPVGEEEHYMIGLFSYLAGDFVQARAHFVRVSPARRQKAAKILDDEGFFQSLRS